MDYRETSDRNRTPGPEFLGIGHPNKILQRDFGGLKAGPGKPEWVARVETYVTVEEAWVPVVEKGFRGGNQKDAQAAADYLYKRVPQGQDPEAAKRMIAAALGATYPFTKPAKKTKRVSADRPAPSHELSGR